MAEFLYDQPRDYYKHGCCTDGVFDPEKAAKLGYSPAQFDAIKEFLGLEDTTRVDTAPLEEPKED